MTTLDPISTRHLLEHGHRVGLRYPLQTDRDAYTRLRQISREHLEQWEPLALAGFDAFGYEFFDRQIESSRTQQGEKLIIIRLEDGALVGHMTVGGIIRGAGQMAHIGYWIGAPYAGQGLMTEAVGLTLRHCFERLHLHRVEANIQPHNAQSIAVVRANGFRYEGLSKGLVQIQGIWKDHSRWAITVEEWAGRLML